MGKGVGEIVCGGMLLEELGLKEEGGLMGKGVDGCVDGNVGRGEIEVEGGGEYGRSEVGGWMVKWIKNG